MSNVKSFSATSNIKSILQNNLKTRYIWNQSNSEFTRYALFGNFVVTVGQRVMRVARQKPAFVVKGGEGGFFYLVCGQLVVFAANLVVARSGTALFKKIFPVKFMLYMSFGKGEFDALGSVFGFPVW